MINGFVDCLLLSMELLSISFILSGKTLIVMQKPQLQSSVSIWRGNNFIWHNISMSHDNKLTAIYAPWAGSDVWHAYSYPRWPKTNHNGSQSEGVA
jgi:hypothetical protein